MTTNDNKSCIEAGILDNALVMIAVLEEKGRVISWNHAAETITGYSRDEVIGSDTIWKYLYPDKEYRKSVTQKIADILRKENYFENLETTIRTRSGNSRIILWNTKKIIDGGKPRSIAVGIDVTTERDAKAFRDSIIDNAFVLIAVLDPNGRIQVWNKAAEMITGYSANDVIGRQDIWKKLYPDAEYRRGITQKVSQIISEHNYFENFETTIHARNGEQRLLSWNTRQIGSGGRFHEIAIAKDITEQRKAEEALVAYMTEMTMRLKQPVGIISNTLLESAQLMKTGMLSHDEIIMVFKGQAQNAAQIEANIGEFQKAIVEKNRAIPEAYRKFLEG
ncbi:PAS domain-containing protein [Methanoregula sp.]|uniref:PAS domain-containing protein n=1 Tax=Methanoregula sp. TaxID=2052170 RepID=UPI002B67868D|nr:PAS domain-containing protein [Methanoregula sp.]HVP96770.1 PAS domain-containing protein [Methanoregula sp.]